MVNPKDLDLSVLPSLPLGDRKSLPPIPAIYFAMSSGTVQYIGMSKNLQKRWSSHRCQKLLAHDANVAWIEVSDLNLLPQIEAALIEWFKPPLNVAGIYQLEPSGLCDKVRSSTGSWSSADGESKRCSIQFRISESLATRLIAAVPDPLDRADWLRSAIAEKLEKLERDSKQEN